MPSAVRVAPAIAALTVVAPVPQAQAPITTPQAHFGFNFGDDYQLANYRQLADYWRTLDVQSDRLVVREIGKTSDGRPHLMAIVTSPANHTDLEKYRDISTRLALAEGLTPDEARALAKQGQGQPHGRGDRALPG